MVGRLVMPCCYHRDFYTNNSLILDGDLICVNAFNPQDRKINISSGMKIATLIIEKPPKVKKFQIEYDYINEDVDENGDGNSIEADSSK
jgi:hypothetical protein